MRIAVALLVIVAALAAARDWRDREVRQPAGVLVSTEPAQRELTAAPIQVRDYTLTPRARFRLAARVLAGERYRFALAADLMPRDLALGWGVMSDSALISQLVISQSDRFYFWKSRNHDLPAPAEQIIANSANMHLIAANETVAQAIDRARVGQVIELDGMLVDVALPQGRGGGELRTSLTRTDRGAGACEIIYVERFSIR
ncbi:MAG: hypothetical protein JNL19_15705 [Burkholderiales bacterium]|nr:hypothetical protein [Burkholderiales bacterium]